MPIYNKRERVERIMQYLQAHKWQQNTADSLGKALDIPVATIRKTLNVDYPQCFDRDPADRRNITLTLNWPDNRPFDLEPAPDKTGKLKAEHMQHTVLESVVTVRALDAIYKWADEGLALKKTPEAWYQLWNTLNLAVSYMQLVKSKDPQDKARRLFDDPESLPGHVHDYINRIERGLNQR
jgi:hypothetical protein